MTDLQLGEHAARLLLEERDAVLRAEQKSARRAREEHAVGRRVRRRDLLRHLVLEVLDQDLAVLVEHREPVAREEDGREPGAALDVLRALGAALAAAAAAVRARRVVRERKQLVRAALRVRRDEHVVLGRAEPRARASYDHSWRGDAL